MKENKSKYWFFILTLVFIVPSFLSLLILPFFTFHDEVQIVNLHQYIKTMDLGQFPPVWATDMQFNYGSPLPEFNYQLPYYLGYIFSHLGMSLTVTFKAILILSLVLGAIGMYLLALTLTTPLWAFTASILYTFSPYRAVTTYVRGTLGEALAFGIFPFVIWGLMKLKTKFSVGRVVLSSLLIAALVLTHQLAAILSLPFIILLTLGSSLVTKDWKALLRQGVSLIFGLLLSAFYWVRVMLEKNLIQESSPFNFYDHFPFIKQLIYSRFAYGASVEGPGDWISFSMGFVNIAVIVVSALGGIFIFRKLREVDKRFMLISLVGSTFLVVFLMNIRSSFFWNIFPFTQMVQFPWRLLMLTTLFTSMLLAVVSGVFKSKWLSLLAIPVLGFCLYPNVLYFQPGEVFDRKDDYYLHRFLPNTVLNEGETISKEYLKHAEDYVSLPRGAIRPTQLPESKITAIRKFEMTVIDDNPLDYKMQIKQVQSQPIIFHTFYYPGWKAFVDNKEVKIEPNDKGYISFEVDKETHKVEIKLTDSIVRRWSKYISLITFVLLLEWFLFDRLDRRRILNAYESKNY